MMNPHYLPLSHQRYGQSDMLARSYIEEDRDMHIQLNPHIEADSTILSGRPVIAGTKIPVREVIEQVGAGKSLDAVAHEYRISVDDVRAALDYAAQCADEAIARNETAISPGATKQESVEPSEEAIAEARALGLDINNISPLGWRLLDERARIVASGEPMLSSWEELDAEIAERRGERQVEDE